MISTLLFQVSLKAGVVCRPGQDGVCLLGVAVTGESKALPKAALAGSYKPIEDNRSTWDNQRCDCSL
jgi:hypothetical protein